MKLTKRQQHMVWACVMGVTFWTLSVSGVLFMKTGPEEMSFFVPPLATILEFYGRALPLTIPFGIGTGLFLGWASLPNKPVTQIRLETLRERVCDHLRETDPKTNELILIFEWAGRLGWKNVEAAVRRDPKRYPYATELLARDAEIIPFETKKSG